MPKAQVDKRKVNRVIGQVVLLFYFLFVIYLLVTRQPNYFSSNKTKGIVAYVYEEQRYTTEGSLIVRKLPVVHFKTQTDSVEVFFYVDEYLRSFKEGDVVSIVYNGNDEGKAKIVTLVGYWVTLNELMASLMLCALVIALTKVLYTPAAQNQQHH